MNPVSAPLARVGDVNLISEGLAVRNATLGDADSAVIPSCLVRKHAMVVERAGAVKIVGRMHDEGVIDADGNWRRARNLHKNRREQQAREKTDGQVPFTPIARLGTPKPSGLTL